MKYAPMICPVCAAPPRGKVETLMAVAEFETDETDGSVDYSGYTDVCWDTQAPILDIYGRVTLICAAGHQWYAEDIS